MSLSCFTATYRFLSIEKCPFHSHGKGFFLEKVISMNRCYLTIFGGERKVFLVLFKIQLTMIINISYYFI